MSFLKDYMKFVEGNEAHPNYHMFAALVALSSVVSRRVWIDLGYFQVHPNLYVVLVGPPAGRKTTAMSICKDLLRELKDIPFSAECVTKEKLVQDLATNERSHIIQEGKPPLVYTPLTICVTELSQFLGAASAHMVDFLTTIYDQPFYELKTKNKGSESIVGPYIVLLSCTTPAWITARLRDDVISGGFSRRAIFVFEEDEGRRIAFPKITDEMRKAWDNVVSRSRYLMTVAGQFKWHPEAQAFFQHWYENLQIPKDPMVYGYYRSKHIQLLKIAMLISVSERDTLELQKSDLEFGLNILGLIEPNLPRVFEGLGRNELNQIAQSILSMLRGGPLPEKEIFKTFFREGSQDEIQRIIHHLVSTDRIDRGVGKKAGQPDRVYIALKGGFQKAGIAVQDQPADPTLAAPATTPTPSPQ